MSQSSISIHAILESSLSTRSIREATRRLSRRGQWRALTTGLIVNDVLMLGAAFWLAYRIRFGWSLPVFQSDAYPSISYYRSVMLLLLPIWLLVFFLNGLYDRRNLLGGTEEYSRLFRSASVGMLIVIIAGFLAPDFIFARGWLVMAWGFSFFLVGLGRFFLRRVVYRLRKRGYFTANALIVGANDEGYSLAQQLMSWRTSGLYVLGFVDDNLDIGARVYDRFFNLGNIAELGELIDQHNVEDLILTTSALPSEKTVSIFKRYGMGTDINLRLSSGLFDIVTTGLEIAELAYVPLVRVNKVSLTGLDRALKFLLDYAITITVLLLSWPFYALIAFAIKFDSPGPTIYRRRVMGQNGREFDAFKFRTMYINGDEILETHPELIDELEQNHKLKHDPRVTRIGRILRQYSLDELPQLFNVLKREMSVVGPRMIAPEEIPMYAKRSINLLTVKPGLTGLWQVSGRSDTSYDERVRLDMQYIRNWTIWSDTYLLWRTIPAVLNKRGAY